MRLTLFLALSVLSVLSAVSAAPSRQKRWRIARESCPEVASAFFRPAATARQAARLRTCALGAAVYRTGEDLPSDDVCTRSCFCWDGEKVCEQIHCSPVACVDATVPEGECCPQCPTGENCWLEGKLIGAAAIVTTDLAEEGCSQVCSCPSCLRYHGNNTQADCFRDCQLVPKILEPPVIDYQIDLSDLE